VNQSLTAPVNVGGLYTTNGALRSAPLYAVFAPTFGLRVPVRDLGEFGPCNRLLATDGRAPWPASIRPGWRPCAAGSTCT